MSDLRYKVKGLFTKGTLRRENKETRSSVHKIEGSRIQERKRRPAHKIPIVKSGRSPEASLAGDDARKVRNQKRFNSHFCPTLTPFFD